MVYVWKSRLCKLTALSALGNVGDDRMQVASQAFSTTPDSLILDVDEKQSAEIGW